MPAPSIRLTAQVTSFDPFSIPDWVGRIVTPPSLGAAFPAPPNAQPPVINLQNIDGTVKAIYGGVQRGCGHGFQLPGNIDTSRLTATRVVDAQVTNLKPAEEPTTGTPNPPADPSNPLRKVDPFNITRYVLTPFRDTTTAQGNRKPLLDPLGDVTKTPMETTTPSAGVTDQGPPD